MENRPLVDFYPHHQLRVRSGGHAGALPSAVGTGVLKKTFTQAQGSSQFPQRAQAGRNPPLGQLTAFSSPPRGLVGGRRGPPEGSQGGLRLGNESGKEEFTDFCLPKRGPVKDLTAAN